MNDNSAGTWECILITPQLAELMLSRMIKNRPLNESRVRQYANAMREGSFALTHQGIAIRGAVLEDGQHRLSAVIRSGVSVLMWVYQYPKNAKDVKHQFDRGVPRTDSHVLQIAGEDVSSSDVSWLRVIAYGRRGICESMQRDSNTLLMIADKHKETLEFVRKAGFRAKRHGLTQAPIVGAFGRARSRVDDAKLMRFSEVFLNGISDGPHESAAQRLREIAMQSKRTGGRMSRLDLYLKTCAAINHFANGTSVKILRATEGPEDPFPDMQ